MKVCKNCQRLNPADAETCMECSQTEFSDVDLVPQWLQEGGQANEETLYPTILSVTT